MSYGRSYTELVQLPTFMERFRYLQLKGRVGEDTLGKYRPLVEEFYHSKEWRDFRRYIRLRDKGCDLGVEGFEFGPGEWIYLHHIEPITPQQIIKYDLNILMDEDNVISSRFQTHQAIHFADENLLLTEPVERRPGDTCLWR